MPTNPYRGQQGNYFARHTQTGEKVICVWQDLCKPVNGRLEYFDEAFGAKTDVRKFAEARDWLLNADKALLTRSKLDASGKPTRERLDYVALYTIKNCRCDPDGLRFEFGGRLESY